MSGPPRNTGAAAGGAPAAADGERRARPKWLLALAAVLVVALVGLAIALGVVYGRGDGDQVGGWVAESCGLVAG